jgi:2-haloalkanoic acid dehalogenase type II
MDENAAPRAEPKQHRFKAVVFDLLTALMDSWEIWDEAARSGTTETSETGKAVEVSGRTWRERYLELTYGCGAYVAYESLVERAAADVGLSGQAPRKLLEGWDRLKVWDDVPGVLAQLRTEGVKLGVVTNCSDEMGFRAVRSCERQVREGQKQDSVAGDGFRFDGVVTAEGSGFYKPSPKPYLDLLAKMNVRAEETLFVAGSAADVPGAKGVGMEVVWHNHVGLGRKGDVEPLKEGRTLREALEGVILLSERRDG